MSEVRTFPEARHLPPPPARHAIPDWPAEDPNHKFILSLDSDFQFTHHPTVFDREQSRNYFCTPSEVKGRLATTIRHSRGGSILVTGYRGTGKTSLVNQVIAELQDAPDGLAGGGRRYAELRINLSTVVSPTDVMVLVFNEFRHHLKGEVGRLEDLLKAKGSEGGEGEPTSVTRRVSVIRKALEGVKPLYNETVRHARDLRADRIVQGPDDAFGFDPKRPDFRAEDATGRGRERTFETGSAIPRHQVIFKRLIDQYREIRFPDEAGGNPDGGGRRRHLIFVFDELDKLFPTVTPVQGGESTAGPTLKLGQLQHIVADLKYFLTESVCHHIFIAGKDVDDSWQEDQNKGEGLFESIFSVNIYVPSFFSADLSPTLEAPGGLRGAVGHMERTERVPPEDRVDGRQGERGEVRVDPDRLYTFIASQIGIPRNSWAYNTTLLVLPHIAGYELLRILMRSGGEGGNGGGDEITRLTRYLAASTISGLICSGDLQIGDVPEAIWDKHSEHPENLQDAWAWAHSFASPVPRVEPCPYRARRKRLVETGVYLDLAKWKFRPASERTCRRYRIALQYLTYKGRGIPRKVLREFYSLVRERADAFGTHDVEMVELGKAEHLLSIPQHQLQRMGFYADIVEHLEFHFATFRQLNDKGRVATFHIIDYILKFFATGFSKRDIEHANFMTSRQEFFPSRALVATIINLLEGRLLRQKDQRSAEYRLLPGVVHDLSRLFIHYGPEQIELRHTRGDFQHELEALNRILKEIERTTPEQRLESIHAQVRLGEIYESLGDYGTARLAFTKALRWVRMDIENYELSAMKLGWDGLCDNFSGDFLPSFISHAVQILHRLGHLVEEFDQLRDALNYYQEAIELQRSASIRERDEAPDDSEDGYEEDEGDEGEDDSGEDEGEPHGDIWRFGEDLRELLFEGARIDDASLFPLERQDFAEGVRPMESERVLRGYVDSLNHAAFAYEKMWERTAANARLIEALNYCYEYNDEYGVIDQLVLMGRLMVRRRDMRTAARCYLEALTFMRDIEASSSKGGAAGWRWQTHPYQTSLKAMVLSAIGDVIFATDGLALLKLDEAEKRQDDPRAMRKRLWRALAPIGNMVEEDRVEEYTYTHARHLFEAVGDTLSTVDVSLHELEIHGDRFFRAAREYDRIAAAMLSKGEEEEAREEVESLEGEARQQLFEMVNTWCSFWRGTKKVLFSLLGHPAALARNEIQYWGKVKDRRRMGTLMCTLGEFLKNLALTPHGPGCSRMQIRTIAAHLRDDGGGGDDGGEVRFYGYFVSPAGVPESGPSFEKQHIVRFMRERWKARAKVVGEMSGGVPGGKGGDRKFWEARRKWFDLDFAAVCIRQVFAYVNDRKDLYRKFPAANEKTLWGVGEKSLLWHVDFPSTEHGECEVPELVLARLAQGLGDVLEGAGKDGSSVALRNLRLLAISEKALMSGHLLFRDCIADERQADATLALGKVYLSALMAIGRDWGELAKLRGGDRASLFEAIGELLVLGKRFLVKGVDILKREGDQGRSLIHTSQEARFNVGDLLLIRLSFMGDGGWSPFGELGEGDRETVNKIVGAHCKDNSEEDVRRQIWQHYSEGLSTVQRELEEFDSRYVLSKEVYYSHRNISDPLVHFRICKAVRRRHDGWWGKAGRDTGGADSYDRRSILEQMATLALRNNAIHDAYLPTGEWMSRIGGMLTVANRVRTDRAAIADDGKGGLRWATEEEMAERFTFFQ